MNVSKINLSLLIFDYEVYPRHKISDYNVNELVQVLESGKEFDPIVWDQETKTIIDGFHRVKAYQKVYGFDYEVHGCAIQCKDKAEMILKGVEYNSKHGLRLSAWDKARCLSLAKKYKIEEQMMKDALAIPEDRLKKLKERIVEIRNKRGRKVGETQLKRGQEKIAEKVDGKYVTEEQAKAIESGNTTGLKADIRIRTLVKDLNLNNFEITSKNVKIVRELVELLTTALEDYNE